MNKLKTLIGAALVTAAIGHAAENTNLVALANASSTNGTEVAQSENVSSNRVLATYNFFQTDRNGSYHGITIPDSQAGHSYSVFKNTNLVNGVWTKVGPTMIGNGSDLKAKDRDVDFDKLFYKVLEE